MRASLSRRGLLAGLGAAGIGVSLSPLAGCGRRDEPAKAEGEEPSLNFYNWDGYIGETTLADFQKSSGVRVNLSLFANNDELFAKLRAGNPGYDVIVPSSPLVQRLVAAKMLQPLDQKLIPNLRNIDARFRNPAYDPGGRHSAPYFWGVIGVGYRKSKLGRAPDSWRWLFNSDQFAGRIALSSEAAELFQIGQKYLGYSLNDASPEAAVKVEAMLRRQKRHIRAFHTDNGQDMLLGREADLVMEYNGDIAQAMRDDPDIGFVIPKEGTEIAMDCLCVPASAPRPLNAHRFINYLLEAAPAAKIIQAVQYPTPNGAARALMPQSYRDNTVIFPPKPALDRSEFAGYAGEAAQKRWEDALTRIRAA